MLTAPALVDALAIGYEVAHRLTTMYVDTRLGPYAKGYHKPSVYSVFGATSGVARLLGLSTTAVANALGIAASQSGGLRANFGTMTKPMHAGIANRTGVEAALLAGSGFTASTEALEQRFGWHDVICSGDGDLGTILDGLGDSYAIEEGLLFKLYPCCGANHYAIDGTIALLREAGLRETGRGADRRLDRTAQPRRGARLSVAENAIGRQILPGLPTSRRPSSTARSRSAPSPSRTSCGWPRSGTRSACTPMTICPRTGARIAVVTTDGVTIAREHMVLRGSLEDPMSWQELERKFRANVRGRIRPDAVDEVIAAISSLDKQNSLTTVTDPLLG